MRILVFANNKVGWHVVEWLRRQGETLAGLVVHPEQRRRFGPEILAAARLGPEQIFDGSQLDRPEVLAAIADLRPDIGVSAYFGYILRQSLLDLLPAGCVNIHPALLPYNRGANPNVWSIVEGTPAGVTIHYIDRGVDTGDLISQREVAVEPVDTGATLYARLEAASLELFAETWPQLRAGTAPRMPQPSGGTLHRARDVARIDAIDLDRSYTGRELIDILRARTFPPYPGAYIVRDGRKIFLRLELEYADEPPDARGDAHDAH